VISLSDLKDRLGVEGSADDAVLTDLEIRAVDFVSHETERFFGDDSTEHVELLRGTGRDALLLDEAPTAITAVEKRAYPGDPWVEIDEMASEGWELQAPREPSGSATLRRKGRALWEADEEYRVSYAFGYAAGEEPVEIRELVHDLVALSYRMRGKEGFQSEAIGNGDYSYTVLSADSAPEDAQSIASRIRRWRVRYPVIA
jgi:hypothetical protein